MEIRVEKNNIRLDSYLKDELNISRSKVQKLIKDGRIFVNDKEASSNYLVKENDVITVSDDLSFEIHIEPEDIPIDVVYEDEYLLIVNK